MSTSPLRRKEALEYHALGRPGKIAVIPTKPCTTQRDLSLAYTPGVAEVCTAIAEDEELSYRYTARSNLVAVISNGTAVLGLGDIGPHAAKPVMEGKGVLFKRFADIDVFDIELATKDPDEVIRACQMLEPTFGGINLEDIKAPECFYIEEKLRATMKIPVFHDDQHGTAIISGAAFLNALELTHRTPENVRVVISGAGAAAIACANLYLRLGVRLENVVLCDSKGVVYQGRDAGMNPYKAKFAQPDRGLRTLADAMRDADLFLGLSVGGTVTKDMVRSMAKDPIVFAMANPDPEITYPDAVDARSDVIMATGRSDYPNQVNNVLGFPFIFRGALDTRSSAITEEMKLAAVRALAELAKRDVPESVSAAYGGQKLAFGREYIIPKPFDSRVLLWVAPAVAKAAAESGVARAPIADLEAYRDKLEAFLGRAREVMRTIVHRAKPAERRRVVFPEGDHPKILKAAQILVDERICEPVLLGPVHRIRKQLEELGLELRDVTLLNPLDSPDLERYASDYWRRRQRHGVTQRLAERAVKQRGNFAAMMVALGDADGLVAGVSQSYAETIRPALQVVRTREGVRRASGVYVMVFRDSVKFFADATVNVEPTAEDLAEIAINTADLARYFDTEPRIAMLSFSSFGAVNHASSEKMRRAAGLVQARRPDLVVDGEMQADTAVDPELAREIYPFSRVCGDANVLIFPDLNSSNIAYKLLQKLGGAEAIGPILTGMSKPIGAVQPGASVADIVNIATITAVRAAEAGAAR